jgi:superfamily II DNA helicase RecQ
VINLPTGSGKSLCAQLPALIRSRTAGVSVVVVPTTALALDQERALKPYINHPTAYYGDDSELGIERKKEIKNRIRQGTQRIIVTSPESLIDSLAPSLYEAAKQGYCVILSSMKPIWSNSGEMGFARLFKNYLGYALIYCVCHLSILYYSPQL